MTTTEEGLILTDRSRYETGLKHCLAARWYRYHAFETGIVPEKPGIDLVFGSAIHLFLEYLFKHYTEDDEDAWLGLDALSNEMHKALYPWYKAETVAEYCQLLLGLGYAFYKVEYPRILSMYTTLAVEREETFIIGNVHQMSKPDLLLRSRATGKLILPDFKTAKSADEKTMDDYRSSVQHMVGTLGAGNRLQEPIEHYMVFVLLKGLKRAEYNPASGGYDGPSRYNNPLIYVYYDEVTNRFEPEYRIKLENGRFKTIGKGFNRVPVASFYPGGIRAWVDFLLTTRPDLVWKHFVEMGPYNVDWVKVNKYLAGLVAHENHLEGVALTANTYIGESGHGFKAAEQYIDQQLPRSWDCNPYGFPCPYLIFCEKQQGWDDPFNNGFIRRTPHHEPERIALEARGFKFPKPPLDITVGTVSKLSGKDETK